MTSLGQLAYEAYVASREVGATKWEHLDSAGRIHWQVAGEAAAAATHTWYESQWARNER